MSKRAHYVEPPVAKPAPATAEPTPAQPAAPERSGRVKFDERGRAVWEWAVRTGMFDRNASTQRVRALTETPVKLELEQTLGAVKRRGSQPTPPKPAPSFNPYEPARTAAGDERAGRNRSVQPGPGAAAGDRDLQSLRAPAKPQGLSRIPRSVHAGQL